MSSLLAQIKARRIVLSLKQHDMLMRVGISRQQYQRLESKGNPRLDTLELIAIGLKSNLLLIPKDKLSAVLAVLADDRAAPADSSQAAKEEHESHNDDPWREWLEDDE